MSILMGWVGVGISSGWVLGFQVTGAAVTSLSFPACCSYEAGILENPKVIDHGHPASTAATGPGASRVFAA